MSVRSERPSAENSWISNDKLRRNPSSGLGYPDLVKLAHDLQGGS